MIALGYCLIDGAAAAQLHERPEDWMDEMIERFMLETGRQFTLLSKSDAPADIRARNEAARTLASLERTLARLGQMQAVRQTRERKVAMSDDELRAALERRLDKLLERPAAPQLAPRTQSP